MRVLVGCEYSGTVRDAFRAEGHDAMSCDLLPTDVPGPHYQGDVRDVLDDGWDLAIMHPECTYLCRAGQRWLHAPDDDRPGKLKGKPRQHATDKAVEFFKLLQSVDIPRLAIENPRPGSHVAHLIGNPSQVVQPYEFGHLETMALPPKERSRIHYASPGPDRWKLRSTTYTGIAKAMATQWGQP